MKTFVETGEHLTFAAPYDRTSGQGALSGGLFGVAANDVLSGADGVFVTRGVFDLTAETHGSTQAIALGGPVYWDNTNKRCTNTAAGNKLIGFATAAKASATAVVRVLLTPGPIAALAHIADITLAAVTGVDGTGSNAASKADVDTRLTTIAAAFNALYVRLEAAGINLTS